jgi:hypothetical protein
MKSSIWNAITVSPPAEHQLNGPQPSEGPGEFRFIGLKP